MVENSLKSGFCLAAEQSAEVSFISVLATGDDRRVAFAAEAVAEARGALTSAGVSTREFRLDTHSMIEGKIRPISTGARRPFLSGGNLQDLERHVRSEEGKQRRIILISDGFLPPEDVDTLRRISSLNPSARISVALYNVEPLFSGGYDMTSCMETGRMGVSEKALLRFDGLDVQCLETEIFRDEKGRTRARLTGLEKAVSLAGTVAQPVMTERQKGAPRPSA